MKLVTVTSPEVFTRGQNVLTGRKIKAKKNSFVETDFYVLTERQSREMSEMSFIVKYKREIYSELFRKA